MRREREKRGCMMNEQKSTTAGKTIRGESEKCNGPQLSTHWIIKI